MTAMLSMRVFAEDDWEDKQARKEVELDAKAGLAGPSPPAVLEGEEFDEDELRALGLLNGKKGSGKLGMPFTISNGNVVQPSEKELEADYSYLDDD